MGATSQYRLSIVFSFSIACRRLLPASGLAAEHPGAYPDQAQQGRHPEGR